MELLETLDPLRLLEEIRHAQHQLAILADEGAAALPVAQNQDLQRFLMSLSTAWHAGEVRPTDRPRQRHHITGVPQKSLRKYLAHDYGVVRGKP